jgi:hypothetical protein
MNGSRPRQQPTDASGPVRTSIKYKLASDAGKTADPDNLHKERRRVECIETPSKLVDRGRGTSNVNHLANAYRENLRFPCGFAPTTSQILPISTGSTSRYAAAHGPVPISAQRHLEGQHMHPPCSAVESATLGAPTCIDKYQFSLASQGRNHAACQVPAAGLPHQRGMTHVPAVTRFDFLAVDIGASKAAIGACAAKSKFTAAGQLMILS